MGRPRKIDDDVAIRLYQEGKSLPEIAAFFGVVKGSVSDRIRKAGAISRRASKIRLIPSELDVAYLAGLFDGEGYATIVLSKSERVHQYWLQIGITNTYLPVLHYVRDAFGVGQISRREVTDHALECWKWTAISRDAAHVLGVLQAYLKIKAEVAALGLEFQSRIGERYNSLWRAEMKARITKVNRET